VTIAARRRTYWSLFLASCACFIAFFPLFIRLFRGEKIPAFLERAGAIGSFRLGTLSFSSHALAATGIGLCALFAALCLGYILYSFRKTFSTEIFFYSFWALSIGLEVSRLVVFGIAADGGSAYWQITATKVLLFSRYAGYLSLFASGLYAAGFRNEKLGTVVVVILAISLGLAMAMPVNTGVFAPTLELRAGYTELNAGLAIVAGLVTFANFLYAAHSTGEASYRLVAFGEAIFFAGHRILVTQWNPFAIVLGFALLVAGSWLFVSRLHGYYLWQ
jgi:hypothetical protein